MMISFTLNGRPRMVDVEPATLVAELLRETLNLTGTHVGCDTSQCGACVVLFNGEAVKSCTLLAPMLDGTTLTTIEGLSMPGGSNQLHPMQQAFHQNHGLQCGFCTPGMVMTAVALAAKNPAPIGSRGSPRARRQYLPLHRLSEYRGIRAGRRGGHASARDRRIDHVDIIGIGAAPPPQGRLPLPDRSRQLRRRHQARRHDVRRVRPFASMPMPSSAASTSQRRWRFPGVEAVLTGEDVAADGLGSLPCGWGIHGTDGLPMKEPPFPILAQGKVRFVGDMVAFVVADTLEQAHAACGDSSSSTMSCCRRWSACSRRFGPVRRNCSTMSPTTFAATGNSATRPR